MGNYPSEYYGAKCYKCETNLPPTTSFKDLKQEYLEGGMTHVFHGGWYYRRVGESNKYQCPDCFWKPKRERERRRREEEERRKREEEERRQAAERRRREEEERRKREEEERRQAAERRRREEEERRKQEEEERRQAAERRRREEEERRKQEEERLRKEAAEKKRQEENEEISRQLRTFIERKNHERAQQREKASRQISRNSDVSYTPAVGDPEVYDCNDLQKPVDATAVIHDELAPISKDVVLQWLQQVATEEDATKWRLNDISAEQVPDLLLVFQELLLRDWWLKDATMPRARSLQWMQVYFLELYCEYRFEDQYDNELARQQLLEVLDTISKTAKNKKELVELSRAMYMLILEYGLCAKSKLFKNIQKSWNPKIAKWMGHTVEFLETLAAKGGIFTHKPLLDGEEHADNGSNSEGTSVENNFQPIRRNASNWAKMASEMLIKTCIPPPSQADQFDFSASLCKLVWNDIWKPDEVVEFLSWLACRFPPNNEVLALILESMLTHRVPAARILNRKKTVLDLLQRNDLEHVRELIKELVAQEVDSSLEEILSEIEVCEWAGTGVVDRVKHIVEKSRRQLAIHGHPGGLSSEKVHATPSEWVDWVKSEQLIGQLNDDELARALTTLCCAVRKIMGWWPRVSQMVSWVVLLLAEENRGRLTEISTGEGKSVIIAMAAVMLAVHGKQVDIVTSSPVLAERDVKEWTSFYELFQLTVDVNTGKTEEKERRACYKCNIVYGTVGCYAADILREEFQQQNIRASRRFDAVIVDEVDFMLLDNGVQFTYLSHKSAGLRHLEPILAMVWNVASRHKPVVSTDGDIFFTDNPKPFYVALADICEIESPVQLLQLLEQEGLVEDGLADKIEGSSIDEKEQHFANLDTQTMVKSLHRISQSVPYTFQPFVMKEDGRIEADTEFSIDPDDQGDGVVPFLVTEKGMGCLLHTDEISLKEMVTDCVKSHIQTSQSNGDMKLDIPRNLTTFVQSRLSVWVENAFLAMNMHEGREYMIEGGEVLPVDYRSTGLIEVNKKWGDGLQQFIELKHRLRLSPMSLVTNFMSNLAFFKRYKGNVYGVSGTLGSEVDQTFLNRHFNVDFFFMPTHRPKKLYEERGEILPNEEEWLERICERVKFEISPKQRGKRKGRAALLICEDMNTVDAVSEKIKEMVTHDVTLYTCSNNEEQQRIQGKFGSGKVIVATNLAGRGTNIKVSDEVKESGGLYVLLTFLPVNTRVEKQAFGRTARKGLPGSAQIILHSKSLEVDIKDIRHLKVIRDVRQAEHMDLVEGTAVSECILREALFRQYCSHLRQTRAHFGDSDSDQSAPKDKHERTIVIDSLNEHWGMWLLMNSEAVDRGEEKALMADLDSSADTARDQALAKQSPSANVYHIIKFGNELMFAGKYEEACLFYNRAIEQDAKWAAIAHYNRAYCIIQKKDPDYKEKAKDDIQKALESLNSYKEELLLISQFTELSWHVSIEDGGLAENIGVRLQILNFFEKELRESIQKLQEISESGDCTAEATSVFSLVPGADTSMHHELYELWQLGLLSIFSVKEKPQFCWDGLIVFCLGALQVAAGILVCAVSMGALTNVGLGLIGEGVSDMIDGTEAMITGKFSWKSWAISKAIGIGASLAGAGIAKLATKGYKAIKVAKGVSKLAKEVKALPKLVSKEITKQGLSESMKNSMIAGGKAFAKEMVEQGAMRAVGTGQEKLIEKLVKKIEAEMHSMVKSYMVRVTTSGDVSGLIERLAASYFKDSQLGSKDVVATDSLTNTFKQIGYAVAERFTNDLEWKQYLAQGLRGVTDKVRGKLKGKDNEFTTIMHVVEAVHIGATVADATATINKLVKEFGKRLSTDTSEFCDRQQVPEHDANLNIKHLDMDRLKKEIGDLLTKILSETVTLIFHQQVMGHVVHKLRKGVNKFVSKHARNMLKTSRTEDELRAGAVANSTAHLSAPHESDTGTTKMVKGYISENLEKDKAGSIQDMRIVAEQLGIEVQVVTVGNDGKMKPFITVGSSANGESVQLVYRKASGESKEGHYDVVINGKISQVDNQGKACLWHAIAKGVKPEASEADVRNFAGVLKKAEIQELHQNPNKWKGFIEKSQWAVNIHNGHQYMLVGAGNKGKKSVVKFQTKTKKKSPGKIVAKGLPIKKKGGTSVQSAALLKPTKKKQPAKKVVGKKGGLKGVAKKNKSGPKGHPKKKTTTSAKQIHAALSKQDEQIIKQCKLGTVGLYSGEQHAKKVEVKNGNGPIVKTNLDHQPPFSVLRDCAETDPASNLAIAFNGPVGSETAMGKNWHGRHAFVNVVPEEHHKYYLTTGGSHEANAVREHIKQAMIGGDPVQTFKRTFIASSPTFVYEMNHMKGTTGKLPCSITDPKRREKYDGLGFENIVQKWYDEYLGCGTPPAMTKSQLNQVNNWIKAGGFKNPTDPTFEKMLEICEDTWL